MINRKWLMALSVLLVLCICFYAYAGVGYKYYNGRRYITTIIAKTFTAAQANYQMLAPAGGNYFIDVINYSNATSTVGVHYMYANDTGTVGDSSFAGWFRAAANGMVIRDVSRKCNDGAGLYATVGGACNVEVEYHLLD